MTHEYVHFSTNDFRSFWKDRSSTPAWAAYTTYISHTLAKCTKKFTFLKNLSNVLGIGLVDEVVAWS